MKINNNTIFPIMLMIGGFSAFLLDGKSAFTFVYPYPIGIWQQPVGALIFIIGFILYRRSAK
jgi:hypothetical protein